MPLPLRPSPLLLPLALARPSCPWGSLALGGLGLGARRAQGGTRGLSLPPHRVKMCSGQGQEGGAGPRRAPLGPSWSEDGAAWQDRGGEAAPESWAASRRRWHCAGPGGKCRRWWAQCVAWRAQRRPPNLGRGRVHQAGGREGLALARRSLEAAGGRSGRVGAPGGRARRAHCSLAEDPAGGPCTIKQAFEPVSILWAR